MLSWIEKTQLELPNLSTMPVVLDMSGTATLRELWFRRARERGARLRLGEIPARVLSEVLAECQKIAGRPLAPEDLATEAGG